MRSKKVILLSILFAGSISYAKYEAHEWGTFTSVVDSTGITQNGMYHEDEPLPDFVHGFGELRTELPPTAQKPPPDIPQPPALPRPCHSKVCFGQDELRANVITQKMETPVIYFYADQAQPVDVNVSFPQGIITETFPGPVATSPTMRDPHVIGNGQTKFSVNILPQKTADVPFVPEDNIYSHARNVNSNLLSSGAEREKFIFYRGLGRFQPKISITSSNGNLKIGHLSQSRPQAAFLVHVDEKGAGQMMSLENIKVGEELVISAKRIEQLKNHTASSLAIIKGEQARGKLVDELMASGLFKDEAIAMVDTWENGYLKVPGLRLLYILPRAEVDEVLPLTMAPSPEKLVRSFVARMEILLDTEEQKTLNEITAEQDRFQAEKLGRFAEPILHRIRTLAEKNQSEGSSLLNLIDQLIKNASVNFEAKATIQ